MAKLVRTGSSYLSQSQVAPLFGTGTVRRIDRVTVDWPSGERSEHAWLLEVGYRHMPVMDEGELLGIVSIRDILWAITSGSDHD